MKIWLRKITIALCLCTLGGMPAARADVTASPALSDCSHVIVSTLSLKTPKAPRQEHAPIAEKGAAEGRAQVLKVASHMVFVALQAKKDKFAIGAVLPVVESASWSPEFASQPMPNDEKELTATLMVSWSDGDGKLLALSEMKRVECPRETLVTTIRGGLLGRLHTRAEVEGARAGFAQVDIVQPAYVDCRIVINPTQLEQPLYLSRERRYAQSQTEATAYAIAAALLDYEKIVRRKVRGDWCKLQNDPWWFASEVMSGRGNDLHKSP